jgi:hypothetical protein
MPRNLSGLQKLSADLASDYRRNRKSDYEKEEALLEQKVNTPKNATKLPTEKRHKDDYKRLKGNIQKSRSDLHVNPKTGKREITTNMVIHKGLTAKEKAGLKKSILKAVKQHLSGSGLHIPLSGGYTGSMIFHEMGKYIPPKDRKLMKKLIEESKPPRPPPIHSGVIDEEPEHHLVEVKPMDSGNMSASDYESDGTISESDIEPKYRYKVNEPDSDSDDDMYGNGFGQFMHAIKKTANKTKQALDAPKQIKKALDDRVARDMANQRGTGVKRPRGRPRKIIL